MLETIHIQNYKSLRDVTLDLKQINLLIGPNNSGKSNFLKSLALFNAIINNGKTKRRTLDDIRFRKKRSIINKINHISPISITVKSLNKCCTVEAYNVDLDNPVTSKGITSYNVDTSSLIGVFNENNYENITLSNLTSIVNSFEEFILYPNNHSYLINDTSKDFLNEIEYLHSSGNGFLKNSGNSVRQINIRNKIWDFFNLERLNNNELLEFGINLENLFSKVRIFKPDINKTMLPYPTTGDNYVMADASNIVSFLDTCLGAYPEVLKNINKDLSECIYEFEELRLITVPRDELSNSLRRHYETINHTVKKMGVYSKDGNIYWAEELSEGALYFIALLAIIHQPNPPKLLLLEEPEKGIHPRRIAEIIRYIQRLADEKDIQVIMTTHSPLVLDEFSHDPESIFVFDKENGETVVRNLQRDIIDKNNAVLKEKGISPIDYEENLSENWLMGLLNGVPND